MNLLSKKIEIENGIIKRITRGESVRIDERTVIDDQCVVETIYEIDPDRYVEAQRLIAVGSADQAQSAIETIRRLWDYGIGVVLQENAKAIHDQAMRELRQ